MPVSFKELLNAYELFGMAGPPATCEVVLCKETGKIYYRSDVVEIATPDEELPDDINDEEKYITLPDRREFDLGKRVGRISDSVIRHRVAPIRHPAGYACG